MSGREYNNPAEEYSKQIEYQDMDIHEYGSQQQYEYNENSSSSEEDSIPREKSKFKKMMQYFVAGVAGAVIVINNAFSVPSVEGSNEIVLKLDYDTYTYTVDAEHKYKMSFDENKMDDYYKYLAEYVYEMTQAIDKDKYRELLQHTSDDWNDREHLNNILVYQVPDSLDVRTSSAKFGLKNENGRTMITTAYQMLSFGSYGYDEDNLNYAGFISVSVENDENLNDLEKMIQTYGGKSKQEIYQRVQGMRISNVSGYFFQSYLMTKESTYINYRCDDFSVSNIFYLEKGKQELIVPTFLKIEKIENNETPEPDEEPEEIVIIDGSNLSQKYYEYAEQFSENYYLVKENGLYGVVDFDGNEIIPIAHQKYKYVGVDEIEFVNGNVGSVYNTQTCQLIFEYHKTEEVPRQYVETIVGNDGEHIITIAMEKEIEYDRAVQLSRDYQGGIFCEQVSVVEDYEEQEGDIFGWRNRARITYKDAYTGEILYTGYSGTWLTGMEDGYEAPQLGFSTSLDNTKAYVVEYDMSDNSYYLAIIDAQGATRTPVDASLYRGKKRYSGDWMVMPYTGTVVNTQTMETYTMPYPSNIIKQWHYGLDEYYGLGRQQSNGSMVYAICKKDTILVDSCVSIGFIGNSYIVYSFDGEEYIIADYNMNDICRVRNYTDIRNGTALVYDGTGIYMTDDQFRRTGDYIYEGTITNCTYGVVQLADKYYLLKTTE